MEKKDDAFKENINYKNIVKLMIRHKQDSIGKVLKTCLETLIPMEKWDDLETDLAIRSEALEGHYTNLIEKTKSACLRHNDTDETKPKSLQEVIEAIIPDITSTRIWFAVYKAFEMANSIAKKDFIGFKKLVENTYTGILPFKISTSELSDLDCLSFRFDVESWDICDAPLKRAKEFYAYKDLAQKTFNLLSKMNS